MELITTQRFLIDLSMAVNIGWTVVVPLAKPFSAYCYAYSCLIYFNNVLYNFNNVLYDFYLHCVSSFCPSCCPSFSVAPYFSGPADSPFLSLCSIPVECWQIPFPCNSPAGMVTRFFFPPWLLYCPHAWSDFLLSLTSSECFLDN